MNERNLRTDRGVKPLL